MDKVDKLFKDGFLLIESLYQGDKLNTIKDACLRVESKYKAKGGEVNHNGIHIEHPFTYENIFFEIIENQEVCSIIETAIGEKITLVNTALDNSQMQQSKDQGYKVGSTWHTDSRYIQRGKVRLDHGFGYIAALCIDDFDEDNSATMYVPKSHLFKDKPERQLDPNKYDIRSIKAKSGDVFLFDTGLWHSAGNPTRKRRWGMFSMYSPWYFKPYFNYTKMFSKEEVKSMSHRLLDLLHFTSTPPDNQDVSLNTIISPEEVLRRINV